MTSELDLWTGTVTETGDEMWVAYTYNDDAVQFIHTEDHTQIWQGRTVVGEDIQRGRIEAHYSHSEDVVMLVAATGHDRPPEQERILENEEFEFDLSDLSESTLEAVLETLLAAWGTEHRIAPPEYPDQANLDKLESLASPPAPANADGGEKTGQELFNTGVEAIQSDGSQPL